MKQIQRLIALFIAFALISLTACAGTDKSRSTGDYVDDKAISARINAKLAQDDKTKSTQIEVITYQGAVQLNGFVDNKEAIRRAEELAKTVEGVKSVKNNLVKR